MIEEVGRGVLVVGVHRSGTSAMTRVINLLGLPVCRHDDLLPHRNGNPTGHWESKTLMACNETLLAALGARWNHLPRPEDPLVRWHALAAHAPAARKAFRSAHPTTTWVWKDPRLCLLISFWRTVLGCDPPIILMTRHPLEVAASLHARDQLDHVTALRLWERSNRHALHGCAGASVLVVHYRDLLADPVLTSHRVIEFLTKAGVPVVAADKAVRAFVDPGLRHAREDMPSSQLAGSLTPGQAELLDLLDALDGEYLGFVPPTGVRSIANRDDTLSVEWLQWFQRAEQQGCRPEDIACAALRGGLPWHFVRTLGPLTSGPSVNET